MIVTILYILWIAYTVGSLSLILLLISLGLYTKWERKKRNKIFYKMMKAEPPKYPHPEDW
jgi:uncharacterized membrane protein YjgN (DUF898 family)